MFDAAEIGEAKAALALPWQDPVDAFMAFADEGNVTFLHSSGPVGPRSRYSYLCVDPIEVLTNVPLRGLELALGCHSHRARPGPVPFCGGAAGFIGYEAAAFPDHPGRPQSQCAGVPELRFGIYDILFAWDHGARLFWLLLGPETDATRVAAAMERLRSGGLARNVPPLAWQPDVTPAVHMQRVARALEYIQAGDIYQANITAPFHAVRPACVRAADVFAALQAENPAPFSAFIGCGGGNAVASVSPERFLSVDRAGNIEARPIKGTRPRGATPALDAAMAGALLESSKDRAENLMIVDLLRNDISRVAEIGSVRVPSLNCLESFASVHHLVSSVTGRLRPGKTAIDLLRAALPGGSITGAPKIRAMQIIGELEAVGRGPYCGSAIWIGFDGAMDSNILIRTVTVAKDRIVAQAGGGIVADSDPAAEWDELMVKLSPMLRALGPLPELAP